MINTKKLPYFAKIVCQTGYHFSSVIPFRLFTCCAAHAFTAVCTIKMQHLNSVHASDSFTFILLKSRHCNSSIGEILHLLSLNREKGTEYLLKKRTMMAKPKCNGTSRTNRNNYLVPNFSLLNSDSLTDNN